MHRNAAIFELVRAFDYRHFLLKRQGRQYVEIGHGNPFGEVSRELSDTF